jgi:hypothetical protein
MCLLLSQAMLWIRIRKGFGTSDRIRILDPGRRRGISSILIGNRDESKSDTNSNWYFLSTDLKFFSISKYVLASEKPDTHKHKKE